MLQFDKHFNLTNCIDKEPTNISNPVFFDIETTGLHHKYSYMYIIGILYQANGKWTLRQWFAEKPSDETVILKAFINFIKPTYHLVHYNGNSFDLPYLQSRCKFHNISTKIFDTLESLDLYRYIKPYQKKLGLEKLTQKSIEQFLGLPRKDTFSGKELIEVYKGYLQSGDEKCLQQLLLHNQEDIVNMSSLIALTSYQYFFEGNYDIIDITFDTNNLIINLKLDYLIAQPLIYEDTQYLLSLNEGIAMIKVPLYHGTLKYFYEPYQDYYYLPAEDKAIHKSVATYVDREYRTPATAKNCYQKTTGTFVPQYTTIITPAFRTEKTTSISYFSSDIDIPNIEEWRPYINHLLKT